MIRIILTAFSIVIYMVYNLLKNSDDIESINRGNYSEQKVHVEIIQRKDDASISEKDIDKKEEKKYFVDAGNKISSFSIDKNSIDIAVNSIISTERNLNKILDYKNDYFYKVDNEYLLERYIDNLTFISDKLDYLEQNASNINYEIVKNEVKKLENYKHTLHTIRDR